MELHAALHAVSSRNPVNQQSQCLLKGERTEFRAEFYNTQIPTDTPQLKTGSLWFWHFSVSQRGFVSKRFVLEIFVLNVNSFEKNPLWATMETTASEWMPNAFIGVFKIKLAPICIKICLKLKTLSPKRGLFIVNERQEIEFRMK